ncbi:conserved hypothetical protein [Vibrio harveyi]|uniref:hypothetical protein n=1 Tax=Vibrio harveyi group TaxID=717610 RepID=UPI001EFD54D7|nr:MULTISPECIES: hypothetical protein [Vibrio harveyi group]MCG9235130.1 hypothetical protein [Vibrio harveyi]MCG9587005.1 hypothetical protein [Vibrio harveyi]MCR9529116.1 hypothetical protein [Vibrio alginolyticus]CAH1195899.1 conserved hypothetical protein [Vibrio harveyi]CAH1550799.1 conserved hypothetical protein [Vibrio harveyi]
MSYPKLFDYINQDWGKDSPISYACYRLIAKIASGRPEDFSHLTFNSIYKLTGSKLAQKDLIQIAQYLSGDRANLLTARFEYISEDESFILSDENSYYAVNEDVIEHPDSGKVIEGVKDDVFMFFELNLKNSDLLDSLYSLDAMSTPRIITTSFSPLSDSYSLYTNTTEEMDVE